MDIQEIPKFLSLTTFSLRRIVVLSLSSLLSLSPIGVLNAILDSKVIYKKTGNPKRVEGPVENLEGFGPKYLLKNQKLLRQSGKNSQ